MSHSFTGYYWYVEDTQADELFPTSPVRYEVIQQWVVNNVPQDGTRTCLVGFPTVEEAQAFVLAMYVGAGQLYVRPEFVVEVTENAYDFDTLAVIVADWEVREFDSFDREYVSADGVALKAQRGEDVSRFFTNAGRMRPPFRTVVEEKTNE